MIAMVVMVVSTAAAVIAWRRGPEYRGWRRWVASGGIATATAAVALFWIGVAPGFFGHPMFRSRRAFADLATVRLHQRPAEQLCVGGRISRSVAGLVVGRGHCRNL